MEYKEEIARIHWKTMVEQVEVWQLSEEILNMPEISRPEDVHWQVGACNIMSGIMTAQAYDKEGTLLPTLDDIADVTMAWDENANADVDKVKESLRSFIRSSEKENWGCTQELKEYFNGFLDAGPYESKGILEELNSRVLEASKKPVLEVEKSDDRFNAYFSDRSGIVPSYTCNYQELKGFEKVVRDYMADTIVEALKQDKLSDRWLSDNSSDLTKAFFKENLLNEHMPKLEGKRFIAYLEQKMEKNEDLREEVEDILIPSVNRDDTLIDKAERTAALLLDKSLFFNEEHRSMRFNQGLLRGDLEFLLCSITEKPYVNEPQKFTREAGSVMETYDIRKARKYVYNELGREDGVLARSGRRLLVVTRNYFNHGGLNRAASYLAQMERDVYLKSLKELCAYVRKQCLDRQHILSFEREPHENSGNKEEAKKQEMKKQGTLSNKRRTSSMGIVREDDFSR